MKAPTEFVLTTYSDEAAFQQYVQRVLATNFELELTHAEMLRYRYRITYFDICGARAIDPWFATVILRSLLYFISILIQPIL